MPLCPNCGAQQPEGAAFCDECGAALQAPQVVSSTPPVMGQARTVVAANICPVCGAQTSPQDPFCTNCGASLRDAPEVPAAPLPQPFGATVVAAVAPPAPVVPAESPSGMIACSKCGTLLEPDSAFCDMCGAPVVAAPPASVATHAPTPDVPGVAPTWPPVQPEQVVDAGYAESAQTPPPVYTPPVDWAQAGPSPASQDAISYVPPVEVQAKLVLHATSAALPLPPGKVEILIGREDPVSGIFPDIDLTDYGGDEGGVSRKHARITVQGGRFYLEDLNSVNHTFVNKERLSPGDMHPLRDGDEVGFGRVKAVFRLA